MLGDKAFDEGADIERFHHHWLTADDQRGATPHPPQERPNSQLSYFSAVQYYRLELCFTNYVMHVSVPVQCSAYKAQCSAVRRMRYSSNAVQFDFLHRTALLFYVRITPHCIALCTAEFCLCARRYFLLCGAFCRV